MVVAGVIVAGLPAVECLDLNDGILNMYTRFFVLRGRRTSAAYDSNFISVGTGDARLSRYANVTAFVGATSAFNYIFGRFSVPLATSVHRFVCFCKVTRDIRKGADFCAAANALIVTGSFFRFDVPLRPYLSDSKQGSRHFFIRVGGGEVYSSVASDVTDDSRNRDLNRRLVVTFCAR